MAKNIAPFLQAWVPPGLVRISAGIRYGNFAGRGRGKKQIGRQKGRPTISTLAIMMTAGEETKTVFVPRLCPRRKRSIQFRPTPSNSDFNAFAVMTKI